MHFLYRIVIFISLFMTTQTLWACLPFSEHAVFIARLQSSTAVQVQNEPLSYNLQFSDHRFVFRTFITRFLSTKAEHWQSDFELQGLAPNDLIIGLAYNPDGDQPANYKVVTLATLSCDNDVLTVNKPLVPYLGWNRDNGSCRFDNPTPDKGLLDSFIYEDETYYLQQLQTKYPTCHKLNAAFSVKNSSNPPNQVTSNNDQQLQTQTKLSFWQNIKRWFGQWS